MFEYSSIDEFKSFIEENINNNKGKTKKNIKYYGLIKEFSLLCTGFKDSSGKKVCISCVRK